MKYIFEWKNFYENIFSITLLVAKLQLRNAIESEVLLRSEAMLHELMRSQTEFACLPAWHRQGADRGMSMIWRDIIYY